MMSFGQVHRFRCKYNGCHYVLAPEVMLHELTCHSRTLYEECKRRMKYPPVPLQSKTSTSNLDKKMEGASSESDNCRDLMIFD